MNAPSGIFSTNGNEFIQVKYSSGMGLYYSIGPIHEDYEWSLPFLIRKNVYSNDVGDL